MKSNQQGQLSLNEDEIAVVVVDVQNAFASEEGSLATDGVDISGPIETLPNVRQFIDKARETDVDIVFTRSVRRTDERDAPSRTLEVVPEIYQNREPICLEGSTDVEYVDGFEPTDDDHEVTKLRYDAFNGTNLELWLRMNDIETVLLCGFMTNGCVEATGRTAYERGFNVVLIEDCADSITEETHQSAVSNFRTLLGTVTTHDQVEFV